MPASRLHPFWRLFLCALALLAVVVVAQSLGLAALLAFAAPAGSPNLALDKRIASIAQTYGLHLTVLSYPAALGILYVFRTRIDKFSWRSLGFSRVRTLPDFARGALTALLTLSTLFSLMWLAGAIRFNGWSTDVTTHSLGYTIISLLAFGVGFGAVGFFEETLFRGYLLANLRQWLGWGVAVAVQAVIFAAIHLLNGATNAEVFKAALAGQPSLALIAIFFALSYRKTGSLWFPIGFHVAWNWLLGCVFSLPVSGIATFRLFDIQDTGTSFLSGGRFGAESSFFLIPLLLAMIYVLSLAPDHPQAVASLDAPESSEEPAAMPTSPAVVPAPAVVTAQSEEEEEPRENRYSARFGSAQGFDSQMLAELKQMQEARDEAERQRVEAQRAARRAEEARVEELRRARLAAQAQAQAEAAVVEKAEPVAENATPVATETSVVEKPIEVAPVAPVAAAPVVVAKQEAAPVEVKKEVAPPRVATPEQPATTPKEPAVPASTPPQPTEAPPKKARPRW